MMLRALFRKQMMEINLWVIQDRKRGKRRSKGSMIGVLVLYAVLFLFLGAAFFGVGTMLSIPLYEAGLGWFYFALMGLLAIALGVFGSVFNTFSSLYLAKDNELLLAMPIRPGAILLVRLFAVWVSGLFYEVLVFLPALLAYWIFADHALGVILGGIVLLLLLSVFVLTLTCILGWVVAKISTHLRNKGILTALLGVVFIALYYFLYYRASAALQSILQNAATIGAKVRGAAVPLYWMGRTGEGAPLPMLLTALIVGVLFAAVWLVMSRTFLKMATTNRGAKKRRYREQTAARRGIGAAMCMKELRRYTSSANYMLNCGLGTILLPAAGVASLLFSSRLLAALAMFPAGFAELFGCAAVCLVASMNDITAPSVSLEGRNLWLAQSLPIPAWTALRAKLHLHLLLTELPALICAGCLIAVLRPGVTGALLMLAMPALFVLLSACFGLFLGLRSPNLTWTSEVVPLKQGLSVTLALLGGWVLVAVLAGVWMLVCRLLHPQVYLLLCAVLFAALSAVLLRWLKTRGARIFASL